MDTKIALPYPLIICYSSPPCILFDALFRLGFVHNGLPRRVFVYFATENEKKSQQYQADTVLQDVGAYSTFCGLRPMPSPAILWPFESGCNMFLQCRQVAYLHRLTGLPSRYPAFA